MDCGRRPASGSTDLDGLRLRDALEALGSSELAGGPGSEMRGWEHDAAGVTEGSRSSAERRKRLVELKARLRDPDEVRSRLQSCGATQRTTLAQRDVYFRVPEGRLKLRHQTPGPDQLVFYRRPNVRDAKESDVHLHAVRDAVGLEELLSAALGVDQIVVKQRDVFEWHGTRVHLDRVEGLGSYLEFERPLGPDAPSVAQALLRSQLDSLGLSGSDLEDGSYADLLRARSAAEGSSRDSGRRVGARSDQTNEVVTKQA